MGDDILVFAGAPENTLTNTFKSFFGWFIFFLLYSGGEYKSFMCIKMRYFM